MRNFIQTNVTICRCIGIFLVHYCKYIFHIFRKYELNKTTLQGTAAETFHPILKHLVRGLGLGLAFGLGLGLGIE